VKGGHSAVSDLNRWTAHERHLCARVMGAVANSRRERSKMQVSTIVHVQRRLVERVSSRRLGTW